MTPRRPPASACCAFAVALLFNAAAIAAAQATTDADRLARHGLVRVSGHVAGRPPIVIAHGDSSGRANPEIFDRLIDELAQDFNVFLYTYQRNMIRPRDPIDVKRAIGVFVEGVKDVEDASHKFDDAIRELVRQTGEETINILGYSVGGLIARDAVTTDRDPGNTLASDRLGDPRINVVLVATAQQGVAGLHVVPVPGLNRVLAEAGGLATRLFSSFFGPLGNRDHPFMRGAIGPNVTVCQVITDESGSGEHVVTEKGQEPVNPADATPADNVHRIKAGHVRVITEHAPFLAELMREKAGLPRRGRRVRRLSMFDGAGAGGAFYYVSAPDMRLTHAQDLVTTIVDGVGQTGTTTRDPADLNAASLYDFAVRTLAIDATVAIASWHNAGLRLFADGSFGRADASLVVRGSANDAPAGTATAFAGEGLAWRIGVRGAWSAAAGAGSGMFVDARYGYERVGEIDVRRTPPVTVTGAAVDESDRLAFRAHVIDARLGYRRGAVSASGGLRHVARTTELSGLLSADFTASAGVPATQSLLFVNRFSERTTELVGGAAVRVGDSPLTVRIDASRGRGWTALVVGASLGIGRR